MNNTVIKNLIQIKNSSITNTRTVSLRIFNAFSVSLVESLYKAGLVQSYVLTKSSLKVHLRFKNNQAQLNKIKIATKPSLNFSLNYNTICRINNNKSIIFISTDRGVLTSIECKKFRVGGTLLFLC